MRGVLLTLFPMVLAAQVGAPAFEVASVRPTVQGRTADGWSRSSAEFPGPGRFRATNSSLDELIRLAYDVKDYQVAGPAWLNDDSECFDIEAKGPAGAGASPMRPMLQTLLAARFKLAVHRETRVLPGYDLVVAKGGPKLGGRNTEGGRSSVGSTGGKVTATNVPIPELAYNLSRWLKQPVFDRTGLEGRYSFTLEYGERDDGERPSLFAALPEQLGLRLNPAKGPVEMLVIDHVERSPLEN